MNKPSRETRRDFLRTGLLAGASLLVPGRSIETAVAGSWTETSAQGPDCEATVLILIQLWGGNDGLNTVIPYADEGYYCFRPSLANPPEKALKINDRLALNGALTGFRELYDAGELALILGVGYPNPSHSHFRAAEIWRTASDSDVFESESWLARCLDRRWRLNWDDMVRMTRRVRSSARYPCGQLASGLELTSRLISAGTPVRAFCLCQGGYDTHAGQICSHQLLLKDLDSAVRAFVADLKFHGNFSRVLIAIFSEFGRRLAENPHGGTEHGSAGAVLIAGGAIAGGIYGHQPDLTNLAGGELVYSVDFRSIYSTLLEKWLDVQSRPILGRDFPTLAFL